MKLKDLLSNTTFNTVVDSSANWIGIEPGTLFDEVGSTSVRLGKSTHKLN